MNQRPLLIDPSGKHQPAAPAVPALLVALEPWHRVFLRNLSDLFRPRQKPPLPLVSRPANFWPDVFVPTRLPWARFLQSTLGHILVIAAVWGGSQVWPGLWPQRPQLVERNIFHSSDVIYYEASEYLAPLDTGGRQARTPQKGEPEHAPQPIISVPPEADNRAQTIVAPPNLKLERNVPLPNIVSWARPKPTIPTATIGNSPSDLRMPVLPASLVAPMPDVSSAMKPNLALPDSVVAPAPEVMGAISRREAHAPQPAIVEPPREIEDAASRRWTNINIGHAQVVGPAPLLPVSEQHAVASMAPMGNSSGAVVPPPPQVQGSGVSGDGRLIALNLHPAAPGGPLDVPAGNRRGALAATPEGKAGAAGTPDIPADHHATLNASGGGRDAGSSVNGVPPGLFVGPAPKPEGGSSVAGGIQGMPKTKSSDHSSLLARATPPVTAVPPRSSEMLANAPSELERQVFGDHKSYSMILNVPNLNSAGGSWVMHFAELKDAEKQGNLLPPVATEEVDPGYPLELMRQNVQGTVILSAVIHSNGAVGDVRILRGVDDRLDGYASAALSRWRFRPATRNGDPVALQTVVMIPFRPMRKAGF
jgi:TonB family protein